MFLAKSTIWPKYVFWHECSCQGCLTSTIHLHTYHCSMWLQNTISQGFPCLNKKGGNDLGLLFYSLSHFHRYHPPYSDCLWYLNSYELCLHSHRPLPCHRQCLYHNLAVQDAQLYSCRCCRLHQSLLDHYQMHICSQGLLKWSGRPQNTMFSVFVYHYIITWTLSDLTNLTKITFFL